MVKTKAEMWIEVIYMSAAVEELFLISQKCISTQFQKKTRQTDEIQSATFNKT